MGMLWRDINYGMRMLRKNPGFAIIAVLTLALGIGANVTIFSLVDVVLFRPLPITKPSEVVRLTTGRTRGEAFGGFVSFPTYQQYRNRSAVFSSMASYIDRLPVNVSAGKLGAERVDAGMVTGDYFQLLGVNAAHGRVIFPEDDSAGAMPASILIPHFCHLHSFSPSRPLRTTVPP